MMGTTFVCDMETAENIWNELLKNNSISEELVNKFWKEIHLAYSSKGRYYHTIIHITQMLNASIKFSDKIQDIRNIQLAIFYHDVVYSATKSDNEERSSDLAANHLKKLNFTKEEIEKCCFYILATKGHVSITDDADLNYFLDFDLEKLGAQWDEYEEYSKQIRFEYRFYPRLIYNKGRKKVLKHFLSQDRIFKTFEYYELYEEQARENLRKELSII